jgi:glycosyltransferase involved in cell wall biosynthesis
MTALAAAQGLRVALVHEWLTVPGGSEKVLTRLLGLLPQAEVFTAIHDPSAEWAPELRARPIHTSFLQRVPGAKRHYPKLLPLMTTAFESFDLSGFDLVVSSSHSCAKNVLTGPATPHVCYCHTPMRHAWEPHLLAGELGRAARLTARPLLPRLRRDDLVGAQRIDRIAANSTHVAGRIRKYWRRDSVVVHPPVEVDRFLPRPRDPEDFYLVAGRVVPYKRADLAVAACARLGRRVKVVGTGRGLEAARAAAGPGAEFLGAVDDAELERLLSRARALLFPGEEDFGIVPVEAQAAGCPVIAYGVGGARDSVVPGRTGVLFDRQDSVTLAAAIEAFERLALSDADIRANAERFRPERFDAAIGAELERALG